MLLGALFGPAGVELSGQRIFLRYPRWTDYGAWAALRRESRKFLEPWEPSWSIDELERSAWRQRLRQYRHERRLGTGETFLILDRHHGDLVGGISIGNIRRGVAQSGHIGYWMGEKYSGKGLMSDALSLVIEHGISTLGLHRIEAACIPDNKRSIRVLEKAGFRSEGLLRSYLRINGKWQDHILFSLTEEDFKVGSK